MRVIRTKTADLSDHRKKQLDDLQEEAIRIIRENTQKMREKVAEATQRCRLPAANA